MDAYDTTTKERYILAIRSAFQNSTNLSGIVENPEALVRFASEEADSSSIKKTLKSAYHEELQRWLEASLQIGPLDNLYDRWVCLNVLRAKLIFQPYVILQEFASAVRDSGRWTPQKVQQTWPKNREHLTRKTIISFLTGGYLLPPKPRIPRSSTLSLRSGFNATKVRKGSIAMERWTHPEIYQGIQDILRIPGAKPRYYGQKPEEDLAAVLYYFTHPVYRAPMSPFKETHTLYRGIHGGLATAFERKGIVHERGFLAFSQSLQIAKSFAKNQVVLVLAVQDIPPGTPWVWFGAKHDAFSSVPREQEVLLPPGSLRVGTTRSVNGHGHMLPVMYRAFYPFGNETFDPSLQFIQ